MNKIVLKSLAIGLAIICFFSCDNNQEPNKIEFSTKQLQTQDSLFKEIMVIHAEVMPLTSTLVKRKDILEKSKQKDSLTNNLILQLGTAEEAMWDWMYAVKPPKQFRDSLEHSQIMEYLNTEFISVSKVKSQMLLAEENSNQLIDNE